MTLLANSLPANVKPMATARRSYLFKQFLDRRFTRVNAAAVEVHAGYNPPPETDLVAGASYRCVVTAGFYFMEMP